MRQYEAAANLEQLLDRYGIAGHSEPALRLFRYHALLEKWNRKINLVSSTSWNILGPLLDEAIWASRFYVSHGPDKPDHLDIGSGAGFPALLLRILIPAMKLRMVESRSKKAAFLETAISELSLENCRVFPLRLTEYLSREGDRPWITISWKGLKLGKEDLDLLLASSAGEASFWIFHGRELPVENPRFLEDKLQLHRRETFRGRKDSFLSIYTRRP